MLRKFLCLSALAALLAGCSSPPEPIPVEWDKPAVNMNTGLPRWQPNNAVIPAPVVTGHWMEHITGFNPDNVFSPSVWYAVAHSSQAAVSAPGSESYFTAKSWLRNAGYKGVITFIPKNNCLSCQSTEIFFYR